MFWPVLTILLLISVFSIGTGIWVILTDELKLTSRVFRYFFLGFFWTAVTKPFWPHKEYVLRGFLKNSLGIFFIIAGLVASYGVWLIVNSGLLKV